MENKEKAPVQQELSNSEMKKIFAELLQEDEKLLKKREETEQADKNERGRVSYNTLVLPVGLTAKIDYISKFLRRIKQLSKDPSGIMNDSKGINLSRYISEVAQNILETRLTVKDVGPILDLTALLHQRYDDFVLHLVRGLLKAYKETSVKLQNLKPKAQNSEIVNTIGRRKAILKIMTDLFLQGFLKEYKNIYSCMRELMQGDPEKIGAWLFSLNLQTISSYLKMYQWTLFRWLSSTKKQYLEKLELTQKFKVKPGLLPEKRCTELRLMFAKYYKMRALKFFQVEFKEMKEAEFFFESSDQEKSEKEKIEAQRNEFIKVRESMDTLADVLGEEPLHKQAIEEEVKSRGKNVLDIEEELSLLTDKKYWPFDDKMEWKFYRKLAKINKKLTPAYDPEYIEQRWWRQPQPAQEIQTASDSTTGSSPQDSEKRQSQERLVSEMEFFVRRLNNCESKAQADEVASLFYTVLNTREHKHRLVKVLLAAPRQQLSLIPMYCRFMANLNFDLPKVVEKVLQGLKEELHRRKKDLKYLEEKIRNVRYLGELTKFELIPPSEIVQFFKEFSEDYEGHSIDLVIVILECCGRYLKRSETMSQKFLTILNKMWKIRNTKKVPQAQLYEFENAYFFLFPKSITKKQKKERPILLEYIRHLLFERLGQDNIEEIADLLSRMPWDEKEVEPYIFKCLLKIAFTGKFTTVNVLASLLKEMTHFYPQLVIRFVDALIEDIEEEAENNDFQMSQHRVLVMRCLGELYNCGVVTSSLLFDVMRELLQEVHRVEQKQEQEEKKESAERALLNDGFHIRLVCTVLETCHLKLTSSQELKRQLAEFLEQFQNTVLRQSYVSMDLEFQILDTLDLYRPSLNRYTDLNEIKGLSSELMETLQAPVYPPEQKKILDLGAMQVTKDQEFESQLSQLISDSLKEANKERLRAPPMMVKGKKALKQQRPLKKLIEQATAGEGTTNDKEMVVLTKARTKILARIDIPLHSKLMAARETQQQSKPLRDEDDKDENDEDLKRKTLMLAGGGKLNE